MKPITRIACRTIGAAGIVLACCDSHKVAKQFSAIGADHAQEHYLEKAYFSSRTTDTVSPSSNALREKTFELRSKNPLPSIGGKMKGRRQGFLYGMSNWLPVIACSSLALLGKNILAKAGAIGIGILTAYKVMREGFGLGKNNPMN